MAPTLALVLLVIIIGAASTKQSNGLSLQMIPTFSEESPLYQPNLTSAERLQKIISSSYARTWRFSKSNPDIVRPRLLFYDHAAYILKIGFGTPPEFHYLFIDTASSVIWVQCVGCNPCFNISTGSFDNTGSSTFNYLSCDHRLCVPRDCDDENRCNYFREYEDESGSGGLMATDRFMFPSSDPQQQFESVDAVFGCGTSNVIKFALNPDNIIAGVFAMGRQSQSFISQLGDQALGRFSYCLPDYTKIRGILGYLRFGSDVVFPRGPVPKSTPFLAPPQGVDSDYYLDLRGISVQGVRLSISQEAFQFTGNGGGVSFDVGSALSYFNANAYNALQVAVHAYFNGFEGVERTHLEGLSLCYNTPEGFNHFPAIRLHFVEADWDIRPHAAFLIDRRSFCMTIEPNPIHLTTNILGAYLQSNYQFTFDTRANRLYFEEKECVNV